MSSDKQMQRYTLSGMTMGTRYTAVFHAPPGLDEMELNQQLFASVDKVDQQMSLWKPDSLLMQLNRAKLGEWVSVSDELIWVLATAIRISQDSGGAFEVGVGELVSAYGFGPEQSRKPLEQAHMGVASHALEIDGSNLRVRKHKAIGLDLNGIAKGFGVDRLAACLKQQGIASYLVGIDGEMRAGEAKPDGGAWNIALEKPLRGRREALGALELIQASVATSGDYRHWRESVGGSYSHTMDPVLQRPLSSTLASVSVISSSCMYADAWATALMVSGVERGTELAREYGLEAIFLLREGDEYRQVVVS